MIKPFDLVVHGATGFTGRLVVEYLLQPSVEERLAEGPSAQIPLNPAVDLMLRVETPQTIRPMEVDFEAAAAQWDKAAAFIRDEFAAAP